MKSYIIGIAGHKGSGKDTVANMINYIFAVGITKATYSDYIVKRAKYSITHQDRIMHFADSLKDVLSIIYNIPRMMFDDRKYKDDYWYCFNTNSFFEDKVVSKSKELYVAVDIDKLQSFSLSTIINSNSGKFVCIKLRTLMQYFGTDICRNKLDYDIWIKSSISKMIDKANSRRLCIVPDVRFANEATAIKSTNASLYGGVILIKRDNCNNSEHSSEIIDFTADYEIDNNGTIMNLFYKILDICQKIN